MISEYCGNNCETCTSKEKLNCPGCAAGPGRKFQATCKLAKCCNTKGHQSCSGCSFVTNCGTYIHRFDMARDRIREQERAAEFLARARERAGRMVKWLWILFWLFIPQTLGGLFTEEFVVERLPGLLLPGVVITSASSLVYIFALFKLGNIHELYKTAASVMLVYALLTGIVSWASALGFDLVQPVLLTIPGAIAGVVSTYFECKAHADAMESLDYDLSDRWKLYWKWYIGSYGALLGSIVVLLISKLLALLVIIAAAISIVVLSILRLVYLYRTAAVCKVWTAE